MIDTCYWFALYNSQDINHKKAKTLYPMIERTVIVVPWPTLYEVLNTKFIGDPITTKKFEMVLARPNTKYIVDKPYRQKAFRETIELSTRGKRRISLVDAVIRKMLENINLRIDGLVTYNVGDFSDICTRRNIQIFG